MKKTNMGLLILCFYLALASATTATVLIPKDVSDLTKEADVVFVGTVIDITSEWADPDKSRIYTYVAFDNLEIIAGDYQNSSLTVRFSGGEMDDVKILYAGVPQFNLGERNLIFLSGNYIELCPVVGWIQGRFRVLYDENVGEHVVHTDDGKPIAGITDSKIVLSRDDTLASYSHPGKPEDSQAQVAAVTGPPTKMTLHAFSQAVRNLRQDFKAQGAVLGYQPPTPTSQAVPSDAMQPGLEQAWEKEKVIGYDKAPQPVQTPTPKTDEE